MRKKKKDTDPDSRYKYNAPQLPNDIQKPWSVAIRRTKLFIYYKDELTPRYIFTKMDKMWKGHGVEYLSVNNVMKWVYQQLV